jgi:hypothetical protein
MINATLVPPFRRAPRIFGRRHRDGEAVVCRTPATMDLKSCWRFVGDRHRDARPLALAPGARQHRTHERGDRNRHRERQDDGPSIREEQLQILADDGEERGEHLQSLKLFPVRLRNTDSSVTRPPPAGAGTRAYSPSSVSFATTALDR